MSTKFTLKYKFGRRLRFLRRARELTQSQLSEQIGCSTEYISRMERGLVSPSFDLIEKTCLVLKIEPQVLFDFTDLSIKE